jgi:rfaE bifunctional protein nucleotidyltransferase chain/domain
MQFLLKDNIEIINIIKAERKKIVFTNGCFDLLHVGHIRYLAQAKKLGDFLIIGLNSDSSVKELKGEDRPINSFEDRANLLSAIESVDLVIMFEEQTPKNLIKDIVPDILVKGGDYNIEDIVGYQTVMQNGGQVKTLSFYDGYSSTNYINNFNIIFE